MGNVSYSAHISNGKSAITSKSKLLGVAKHNLRKYKSPEYSSDNILLLRGTEDLYQDVKNVYHQEFDEAVQQYNQKQKRADRRIEDYFEHVANLNQDMAGEEEDSWKSRLERAGYQVECRIRGLGEVEAIRKLYVAHVREAEWEK